MPLAFPSLSHGTVAFGFFNIETDMLLLESLFFFADRFCAAVTEIAGKAEHVARTTFPGWRIDTPRMTGNLHGAIRGTDLSGFIGRTYERFPFPSEPKGFKQKPDGEKNQAEIRKMIEEFGRPETIVVEWDPTDSTAGICEFRFHPDALARLIAYVEQGGYPRWKDEIRPQYVREMTEALACSEDFPKPGSA